MLVGPIGNEADRMLTTYMMIAMLVLLVVVLIVLARVLSSVKAAGQPAQNQPPAAAMAQPAASQPYIQPGIPGEVVAAISAAVASLEGGPYVVHSVSVRHSASGRGPWGQAGVTQLTHPF